MKTVDVYVRMVRADGTEYTSPTYTITQSEYDEYLEKGTELDRELWPSEWEEFEDEIYDEGEFVLESVECLE